MEATRDGLWDPASGRFHRARLLREMMVRLWTPDDLASEAKVSRTSVYKMLAGEGVLPRTAYKVLLAFQRCPPVLDVA